jgi:hypothetical protein
MNTLPNIEQRRGFGLGGTAIALLVLGFIGFVFVGIGGLFGSTSWRLVQNGQQTTGVVVDQVSTYDSEGGTTYLPVFRYRWLGVQYVEGADFSSNPPRYEIGEEVTLWVNPDDPAEFVPDRFVDLWLMPLIFGGVGAILLVIAFFIFIFSLNPMNTMV